MNRRAYWLRSFGRGLRPVDVAWALAIFVAVLVLCYVVPMGPA